MLNKLAVPNLTMATNIESERSEVSVEEIEVIIDDVYLRVRILFYFVTNTVCNFIFTSKYYLLGSGSRLSVKSGVSDEENKVPLPKTLTK